MSSILILGGGFGGVVAAEKLAASLGSSHQITLVAPNQKFTFYPALVQLAFGKIQPEDIQFDLDEKLREIGVRYVQGEMIRIHPVRRKVEISGDDFSGEIAYDYLVIAVGRRLATEKVPGFFENAQHLLGVNAALKFGILADQFREGRILVGLCPDARLPVPVCETAFALAKKFEAEMEQGKIQVSVIFPESLEAAFGGARLHKELEAAFKRHRISVHYEVPIREITFNQVNSSEGHEIKCDLLMLVPPFRGNSALRNLNVTDESDFVRVDGMLRVHELDRTYAIGDIVAFSGPKLAHMAVRQAEVAAANIVSEINGEAPTKEYYHEIAAVIDANGPDSIYLHYGIWDDTLYRLKKGRFWSWAKEAHDALWRTKHQH
ncbi:MAG: FAD-dependent oxidoreductase [bacterium]|nr:FAD-dependent oxidoreductase [bacterium]